ncbi:hypothetical protein ACX80I_07405 [Arthrobacter sp. MDT3-44]
MNHNALVARFVPIGDGVPACDALSTPASPGSGALVARGEAEPADGVEGRVLMSVMPSV